MAVTQLQGLPVPSLGDPPNGPAQILAFAAAVEKLAVMYFATIAARTAAIPAPTKGMLTYIGATDSLSTYNGVAWVELDGRYAPLNRVMGYAQVVANQATVTAVTDVTGLTVAFTAVTGHRYRTTVKMEVQATVTTDLAIAYITDAANAALQRSIFVVASLNGGTFYNSIYMQYIETPAAGAVTRKVRIERNAGTGLVVPSATATNPAFILVEDIGA